MANEERLDRYELQAPSLLNDENDDDDLDERFPEFAEFVADEDNRAELLERLKRRVVPRAATRALGETFENWLGEGDVSVADIIDDAQDLADLKSRLITNQNPVRACGTRHSDNRVALPDPGSLVVDLSRWRIKRSSGFQTDSPCNPVPLDALVKVTHREHSFVTHESMTKRAVLMFGWETLQDIAQRGENPSTNDPKDRFGLINSGSFTYQSLAGPLSVGTHGSGSQLGSMSDAVVALDILRIDDGQVLRVMRPGLDLPLTSVTLPDGRGEYTPQLSGMDFNAAVVNLGTLGVVLAYWVEVKDYYWLTQRVENKTLDEALDYYEEERRRPASEWRHIEFLLMPEKVNGEFRCSLIRRRESPENVGRRARPDYPKIVKAMRCDRETTKDNALTLSQFKSARKLMYKNALSYQESCDGQTGPWWDVLIRNTLVPAHGFEIAVPAFRARFALRSVLDAIRKAGKGIGKRRCKPTSPIGVRFVRGSEQYLAMNHRHFETLGKTFAAEEWCFIEVPRLWGTIAQARIPLEIVKRLKRNGEFFRLHWGQYAPVGSRDAAREYPSLRRWLAARVHFGAGPRLLTAELARTFGLSLPRRAPRPRAAPLPLEPGLLEQGLLEQGLLEQGLLEQGALEQGALGSSALVRSPLVLCVHGIGDHRSGEWKDEWSESLTDSLEKAGVRAPRFLFVSLDDLFQKDDLTREELSRAALQFASSWLRYRGTRNVVRRVLSGPSYLWEWFPAMVAKWASDEVLRSQLRARVGEAIRCYRPTIIAGHSLGSLVCYDTLTHAAQKGATDYRHQGSPAHFLSFGSQIGHPSVRFVWGGRLVMPQVSSWVHLYNPHDEIFTAPIRLPQTAHFSQWELSEFPGGLVEQHAATSYLSDASVVAMSLAPLLDNSPSRSSAASTPLVGAAGVPSSTGPVRENTVVQPAARFPQLLARSTRAPERALLVGINRHANPSWDLEGCVNDVYKMSALLQTRFGYDPKHIRVLVDERATAENIRERMEWLLEDATDDARRLFYFSGHGTRIPGYNALEVVDQQDECLVTHDFSWDSQSPGLVDDEFLELYSQLPYGARFTAVFDCCHASGMSRGGGSNVRGLTPPDDIRHRLVKFDEDSWLQRATTEDKEVAVRAPGDYGQRLKRSFLGSCRSLRTEVGDFSRAQEERSHEGPYMPVLIYACSESELAFEHRSGTVTHGAFTHSMAEFLSKASAEKMSVRDLVAHMGRQVQSLGYTQTPTSEGPRFRLEEQLVF